VQILNFDQFAIFEYFVLVSLVTLALLILSTVSLFEHNLDKASTKLSTVQPELSLTHSIFIHIFVSTPIVTSADNKRVSSRPSITPHDDCHRTIVLQINLFQAALHSNVQLSSTGTAGVIGLTVAAAVVLSSHKTVACSVVTGEQ